MVDQEGQKKPDQEFEKGRGANKNDRDPKGMPGNRIIEQFSIVIQPHKRSLELRKADDDSMKALEN